MRGSQFSSSPRGILEVVRIVRCDWEVDYLSGLVRTPAMRKMRIQKPREQKGPTDGAFTLWVVFLGQMVSALVLEVRYRRKVSTMKRV
jgi:hypothetical protein